MDFKQLLDFIALEDDRLKVQYGHPDDTKRILARTVKITEELGELSNEILAYHSMQRAVKMDNHTTETLHEEIADVLITTLLLAKTLNMDIEKVLEAKIEKINKRHENSR